MSSTVFAEQNSSPVQTRRIPIRNNEMENASERPSNRRSLSGKFRNLFRKNSSSPARSAINYNESRPPPAAPIQYRSSSPSPIRPAIEAPHLRAPILNWPFGKKKPKLTGTTSDKPKRKESRKTKKTSRHSVEISTPVYQQEHQTAIRGQNFVPRTPELTHGATGRTQSPSSYETPTKGFRDYMVVDNIKSSQQVVPPDVDAITPPPYPSDRSRSPSLTHQTLPDTSIEHSYYHDHSPPHTDIEIVPYPQQRHAGGSTSLGTATQILIENNPLRSSTVIQPTHVTINSDQWKNTSYSSLNHSELRSTTSSSMDVDVPKLNAPLIPLSSTSSKQEPKQTHFQFDNDDSYNSSSAVNNLVQSNRNTYSSLPPESNTIHNENFTPLKSTKSNSEKYPTLSAIVEHHLRPISSSYSTNSKYTKRFDTSTTTSDGFDQRPITISNGSPSSIHRHDGYIRPLTPKSSVQPDVSTIHVNLDDLRGRSSNYNSVESPIIYRSSTIIYTRDKHNYGTGGELRTWSIQENNNNDNIRKASTSIQIFPSRVTNEYHYNIGAPEDSENVYEHERQFQYPDTTNHSNMIEREKYYDQSTRSYKVTDQTQESLNPRIPAKNFERHYTLKRTDSYDGLGIYISTDAKTRLNHRIRDIEPNSPGSRVGLRVNDRITHVNGINVENTQFGDVLVLIKQGLINNNLQFSVINE